MRPALPLLASLVLVSLGLVVGLPSLQPDIKVLQRRAPPSKQCPLDSWILSPAFLENDKVQARPDSIIVDLSPERRTSSLGQQSLYVTFHSVSRDWCVYKFSETLTDLAGKVAKRRRVRSKLSEDIDISSLRLAPSDGEVVDIKRTYGLDYDVNARSREAKVKPEDLWIIVKMPQFLPLLETEIFQASIAYNFASRQNPTAKNKVDCDSFMVQNVYNLVLQLPRFVLDGDVNFNMLSFSNDLSYVAPLADPTLWRAWKPENSEGGTDLEYLKTRSSLPLEHQGRRRGVCPSKDWQKAKSDKGCRSGCFW